jgi:vanillate O-demethylase monooxygenase subunit
METFPLNAWYAAAWDVELRDELLARTVCDQRLVMYRRTDGTACALEDACWHRLLPLSMGRLDGDRVVCGYHGLAYDGDGRCIAMPHSSRIRPSACVRSFPVVERHRFVWVWPGDPAQADPARIPDLHWNDDPAWAGDGKLYHLECDYRLVIDNLMDLSHEAYVHGSSIGNRAVAEAPAVATEDAQFVQVTRWMEGVEAPPFWATQLQAARGHAGPVDRWQVIRFEAPATIAIDVGVAPAGSGAVPGDSPRGDRSGGINGFVLNTITPESGRTCHYFWSFCRNYRLVDQRLTHTLREAVGRIFLEDEAVLTAQQRAIDHHPNRQLQNLAIDAGSVRARRRIERMIAAEAANRPPDTAAAADPLRPRAMASPAARAGSAA